MHKYFLDLLQTTFNVNSDPQLTMRRRMPPKDKSKSKKPKGKNPTPASKTRRSSAAAAAVKLSAKKRKAVKEATKETPQRTARRSAKTADEKAKSKDVQENGAVPARRGRPSRQSSVDASKARSPASTRPGRRSEASNSMKSGDEPPRSVSRGRPRKSDPVDEKKAAAAAKNRRRPKRDSSSHNESPPAKKQSPKVEESCDEAEKEGEPAVNRRISRKTKEQAAKTLTSPQKKALNQPQEVKPETSEPGPSRKRRASSSGDASQNPKKVRPSQLPEDPYDFEAYAWGAEAVPKARKPARRQDALKKAQKARKARKAMAHMFFIQPSRAPCKKKAIGAEKEELQPSPSIADEIAEIVVAPPAVDDEVIVGPRLCAERDRFSAAAELASTPRLTAAPVVRPLLPTDALSPINSPEPSGLMESGRPSDVRPLVESSRANSLEALEPQLPSSPARSEDKGARSSFDGRSDEGKIGSESPKRSRKKLKEEHEKDEFEQWLSKFNQELSDIEAFQLSIDDSR